MLGTACFRLCTHRSNLCSPTLVHSYAHHCIPHPSQVTCRHVASTSLCRSLSWPRIHEQTYEGQCSEQTAGFIRKRGCHGRLCAEKRGGVSRASTRYTPITSHHPSVWKQETLSSLNNTSSFGTRFQPSFKCSQNVSNNEKSIFSLRDSVLDPQHNGRERNVYGLKFPDASTTGNGKFAMAMGLLDGSWNVAWDVRPARWLHGRHSAWLLSGARACLPVAMGLSLPLPYSSLSRFNGAKEDSLDGQTTTNEDTMEGKQVFTDYYITGIPGDGRCLFRAIVYSAHLREGQPAPGDSTQQQLADELRAKVVDELISRRADCEWFIEEDFDTYTRRMRECYVWGGEPEILMASHVLRAPIIVYLLHQSSCGIISIAEYGLEYGSENPIRILYHGFGHYDAIQVPGLEATSKL